MGKEYLPGIPQKKPPLSIKRKYALVVGENTFKWIVVYSDYSITIGAAQMFSDHEVIEWPEKTQPKEKK